jgi:hypothetical protein
MPQLKPDHAAGTGAILQPTLSTIQPSPSPRFVDTALTTYADAAGEVDIDQSYLANKIGRSRSWVNAAARELEQAGLVLIQHRFVEGRQARSRYRLPDGLDRGSASKRSKDDPDGDSWSSSGSVSGSPPDSPAEAPASPPEAFGQTGHLSGSAVECRITAGEPADTIQDSGFTSYLSGARESDHDHRVPADWRPSAEDAAWAIGRVPNLDVDAFSERFVLTCRAKDYRYADPGSAWQRWLLDPKGPLPLITEPIRRTSHRREISMSVVAPAPIPATSVAPPTGSALQISRPTRPAQRLSAWSDSWADEPMLHLPDLPPEMAAVLPLEIDRLRADLAPGDPREVLVALTSLATRRGSPLPDEPALQMDVDRRPSLGHELERLKLLIFLENRDFRTALYRRRYKATS